MVIGTVEPGTEESPKGEVRAWSRYWARYLDTQLFILLGSIPLSIFFMLVAPDNWLFKAHREGRLGVSEFHLAMGFMLIGLWMFVEALFLSTWGTTPGKALFRVTVRNQDGSRLSYGKAFQRAAKVWCNGLAFGIPIGTPICEWFSYKELSKAGKTSWDAAGQWDVKTQPLGTGRVVVAILLLGLLFLIGRL